ncbi:MAG: hypothetical protein V1748_13475 [Actinomycetota bacterium]
MKRLQAFRQALGVRVDDQVIMSAQEAVGAAYPPEPVNNASELSKEIGPVEVVQEYAAVIRTVGGDVEHPGSEVGSSFSPQST